MKESGRNVEGGGGGSPTGDEGPLKGRGPNRESKNSERYEMENIGIRWMNLIAKSNPPSFLSCK